MKTSKAVFFLVLWFLSQGVLARELLVGFLSLGNDPRYSPQQLERAYPNAPAGRSQAALAMAIDDAAFNLQAAGISKAKILSKEAADEAALPVALQALISAGAHDIVLELPASGVIRVSQALRAMPEKVRANVQLINTAAPEDILRGSQCAPFLLHTLPSHSMQMDAIAQLLAARKWNKPLVLFGTTESDTLLRTAWTRSAKRFGIKPVAERAFKLSNDPRERDAGNVRLLTASSDYDGIVVLDANGEFARDVPYRSVLPRLVLGSSGLTAQAWSAYFDRDGAVQLNRRFIKRTSRLMGSYDWATWLAGRAIVESTQQLQSLRSKAITLDGYKGQPLSFRAWDGQLRQPLLLMHADGVADIAPLDGFLHAQNTLDTLGFDMQETRCKP